MKESKFKVNDEVVGKHTRMPCTIVAVFYDECRKVHCYVVNHQSKHKAMIVEWDLKEAPLPELKPCPFCGNTDIVFVNKDYYLTEERAKMFKICCDAAGNKSGCGSCSGAINSVNDIKRIVNKWNNAKR